MFEIPNKNTGKNTLHRTTQKMKFSIKDFCRKCDLIRSLQIWPYLLKKLLMEKSIFVQCRSRVFIVNFGQI